jgi:hypothetical protein
MEYMGENSVASMVREILLSEPSLYRCLEAGVLNYSKLARKFKPVLSTISGFEVSESSIKMALIRLRSKIRETPLLASRDVLSIIANTRVEAKTGVAVVIVRSTQLKDIIDTMSEISLKARFAIMIQSSPAITIVLDEEATSDILRIVDHNEIIEVQRDLAAITATSPREIMWVPGVVAYITGVLAQNGVNIIHIGSSYTDTVIVVSKKDLLRAFNTLIKHIELARKLISRSSKKLQEEAIPHESSKGLNY